MAVERNSNEVYRYAHLHAELNQIRVLCVHAGELVQPIQSTLRHVSLDANPIYAALSYTWGDPAKTESINVDGKVLWVTENLAIALKHIRTPTKDIDIWM